MVKYANEPKTMQYLFRHMRFAKRELGDIMFSVGDVADFFYVILQGEVAVMVPGPYKLEGKDATPDGVLLWTLLNYEVIHWPKMP